MFENQLCDNKIFHRRKKPFSNFFNYNVCSVLINLKKLDKINKIVHPQVFENYNDFIKKNSNSNTVYESALLFDYDNFKKNDYNILITCPENIRIERIMSRDNLEFEEVPKNAWNKTELLKSYQKIKKLSQKKINLICGHDYLQWNQNFKFRIEYN